MTESNSTLAKLANKGDVQAITTLINRYVQSKGITAKVAIKGDCLQVLLEAQEAPEQQALTNFARRILTTLKINGIYRVNLYGRKTGDEFPEWNIQFEIVAQTPDQPVSTPIKLALTPTEPTSKLGGSFGLSSNSPQTPQTPQTPQQEKIAKSKALEYGIAGAVFGLIISFPSVWAAFQMFQIQGGGNFTTGYVIGICVVVFIGYLSGFSQGFIQFGVKCPSCNHNFILSASGGNCPACSTGLYIDERGDCQVKM